MVLLLLSIHCFCNDLQNANRVTLREMLPRLAGARVTGIVPGIEWQF
jgi:hypothetical protein